MSCLTSFRISSISLAADVIADIWSSWLCKPSISTCWSRYLRKREPMLVQSTRWQSPPPKTHPTPTHPTPPTPLSPCAGGGAPLPVCLVAVDLVDAIELAHLLDLVPQVADEAAERDFRHVTEADRGVVVLVLGGHAELVLQLPHFRVGCVRVRLCRPKTRPAAWGQSQRG